KCAVAIGGRSCPRFASREANRGQLLLGREVDNPLEIGQEEGVPQYEERVDVRDGHRSEGGVECDGLAHLEEVQLHLQRPGGLLQLSGNSGQDRPPSTATRVTLGTACLSSSSCFAASSPALMWTPVMFPPGR